MSGDSIDFGWHVVEVHAGVGSQPGATVRFVPDDASLSTEELFVPVPWHKCRDADHARKVLVQKISAYAPVKKWRKQRPDESTEFDLDGLGNESGRGAADNSTGREKHTGVSDSAGISEGDGNGGARLPQGEVPGDS